MGGGIFPVNFFDGEGEIYIGNVVVSPTMTFKAFQSIISQKIGISPHQITIYLEKNPPYPPLSFKSYRKIPVTSKFNFGSISGDSNCFFRAVLKRSRRTRRKRPPKKSISMTEDDEDYNGYSDNGGILYPENFVLLRRNANPALIAGPPPVADNWYQMRRYLMSPNLNSSVYSDLNWDLYSNPMDGMMMSDDGGSSSRGSSDKVICDVCEKDGDGGGETVPFHLCKYDVVTEGWFRSLAGPIARPIKLLAP
ncbi:hypothetical protein Dimus_034790 [Dionaea muscipula]